jgi:hypothetical protein
MKENFDHAEKINALTLVIRSICEENNINKAVVIDDFIYMINREYEEKRNTNELA